MVSEKNAVSKRKESWHVVGESNWGKKNKVSGRKGTWEKRNGGERKERGKKARGKRKECGKRKERKLACGKRKERGKKERSKWRERYPASSKCFAHFRFCVLCILFVAFTVCYGSRLLSILLCGACCVSFVSRRDVLLHRPFSTVCCVVCCFVVRCGIVSSRGVSS